LLRKGFTHDFIFAEVSYQETAVYDCMQENPKGQKVQTKHPPHSRNPTTKPNRGLFLFVIKFVINYKHALSI